MAIFALPQRCVHAQTRNRDLETDSTQEAAPTVTINRRRAAKQQPGGPSAPLQPIPVKWVTLKLYAQSSGYTPGALHQKIRRGQFIEGQHFRKAPDRRILMNVEACQNWGISA